jgi:hypothetical protein
LSVPSLVECLGRHPYRPISKFTDLLFFLPRSFICFRAKYNDSSQAPAENFTFSKNILIICSSWDLYGPLHWKSHKEHFTACCLWYEIYRLFLASGYRSTSPIHRIFDVTSFSKCVYILEHNKQYSYLHQQHAFIFAEQIN